MDEFLDAVAKLPANPIAPENRNVARLVASQWVPRGEVYRVVPSELGQHFLTFDPPALAAFLLDTMPRRVEPLRPLIVMNVHDVDVLRTAWLTMATLPMLIGKVDQEIADALEQLFAEREAREGR